MSANVGDIAPDFELDSTSGERFKLSETFKDLPCIIYFYPKNFTPGCTKEACDFRDNFSQFKDLDIAIVGISKDSIESHLKFKEKYNLQFDLLSDPDGSVCRLYDSVVPILGIPKRKTFFIDRDHKITAIHQDFFGSSSHVEKMVKELTNYKKPSTNEDNEN